MMSNLPLTSLDAAVGQPSALPAGAGGGASEGFLVALSDALSVGDTALTPEALVDWLRQGGGSELPQAGELVPLLEAAEHPGARDATPDDPLALLGLILDVAGAAPEGRLRPGAGAIGAGGDREAMLLSRLGQHAGSPEEADAFRSLVDHAAGQAAPGGTVATPSSTAGTSPQVEIRTPVQSPQFGQEVGERLVWMVREGVQQAKVALNPPGLGPLELSVQVQDDGARVSLTAQHAVTREALAADVARLRTMLEDQGFVHVEVNVSQHSAGGPGGEAEAGDGGAGGGSHGGGYPEGGAAEPPTVGTLSEVLAGRGLVDHYV